MVYIGVLVLSAVGDYSGLCSQAAVLKSSGYAVSTVDLFSLQRLKNNWLRRIALGDPMRTQKLASSFIDETIFERIQISLKKLINIGVEKIVLYAPTALTGIYAIQFAENPHYAPWIGHIIACDVPLAQYNYGYSKSGRPHIIQAPCKIDLFYGAKK